MFCFRWPQTIVILLPHTVYSIALNFCLHFTISSLKKTKKTNRISSFVYFFFFYVAGQNEAIRASLPYPFFMIYVSSTRLYYLAMTYMLPPRQQLSGWFWGPLTCVCCSFLWNTKYSTSSWEWPRELTMTHTNCLSAAGVTHVNIWQRSRENQHTHNNKKWLWKKKIIRLS